jgi:DNA-binding transcriptional LysR family regulator
MNHLDPLWLRSFLAIAHSGSVTAAARSVHRVQSAVSTHLRQLEGALGVRLVERSTRSLALTSEGRRLLPYAQRLLVLQDEARAAMKPQAEAGVLRVGISEYYVAPERLHELLSLLDGAAGGRRLELLWSGSQRLLALWRAGEMDLAVVAGAEPPSGAKLLRRDPLSWVCAPGFVLPSAGPAPLVLLGADCVVREIALEALARTGRPHALRLSCSGSTAAVAAMRAGWGAGCLNAAMIPADFVRLPWPSPGRLAFHLLSSAAAKQVAAALADWAR